MNALRITILSGYASPKTLEFGDNQGEIRIGRAPESEVRLDPTRDTASSRGVHARLARGDDGAWFVECLHASGVGVVGAGDRVVRRLDEGERTPVLNGLTFEIGVNGPRLRTEDASGTLPGTEIKKPNTSVVPHVPQDVIGKARRSSRRVRVVSLVGVAAIAIGSFTIFMVNRSSHQGVAEARKEATEQLANVQKDTQSDIDDVREETQSHINDIQSETLAGLEELRTLTSEQAMAFESEFGALKGDLSRVEAQAIDRMGDVMARVARSVWSVGVEDSAGTFTLIGTAWTGAPDTLVTNAHVAEAIAKIVKKIDGSRIVARQNGASDHQLLIAVSRIHPGYSRWSRAMANQFAMRAGGGAARVRFVPPADVATLRVVSGDPGEPLPLASVNSKSPAVRGAVVGYVGYPAENLAGLPTMQTLIGRITAITDFFFGDDPSGEDFLIHYDAPTVGGASGSPLVNRVGEVVGVVSGGSNVRTEDQDRVPLGFNYAQRVDLVAELLSGQSESNQLTRDDRWRERLNAVVLPPVDMIDRLIHEFQKSGEPELVGESSYTLNGSGIENSVGVRVPLTPGYRYIAIAVAEDWTDIDLIIRAGDQQLGIDKSLDWHPVAVASPVEKAIESVVYIIAAAPPLSGECKVTLRIYRVAVSLEQVTEGESS